MDWKEQVLRDGLAEELRQYLEAYISKGHSVEEAFSVLQERYMPADEAEAAHLYPLLTALQLQYGTLQQDVQETVVTLLAQGLLPYPQQVTAAMQQELSRQSW